MQIQHKENLAVVNSQLDSHEYRTDLDIQLN